MSDTSWLHSIVMKDPYLTTSRIIQSWILCRSYSYVKIYLRGSLLLIILI